MVSFNLLQFRPAIDSWVGRLAFLCLALSAFYVFSTLCQAFYNLYLHPLRKYPGPKLWIAFPFFRSIASVRGVRDKEMQKLHQKYGAVLRFSPNELSFITAQAWKDIYGHGHRQLRKAIILESGRARDIIGANDADHTRFRKALAHGFSEKALSQQEPMMMIYINLLIEKLRDVACSDQKTDMVQWYNLTTFDLIGDLAFGASFDGLKTNRLHSWIAMIFKGIKFAVFLRTARDYPLIGKPLMFILSRSGGLRKARQGHRAHVKETTLRRINNPDLDGRGDFMDAMQKHKGGPNGLSEEELIANANILVIAGSETTATLLSGVTYLLLKNPHCLRKVTEEVRGAFEKEEEINFVNASSRLPYMLACLDEASRMYPPVPTGLSRIVPPGAPTKISGHQVPPGTLVSVHQSAAYLSPSNFTLPNSYFPERWLHSTPPEFLNDNRAVLQPFSVGPRNCIGRNLAYNEMRLILARVLWNFDLALCEESQSWIEQKTYLLWEKPPLFVTLRDRAGVKA